MLLDVAVVEQRQQAVLEVMRGLAVSEVARRYGVTRQSVHRWLRRYAASGLSGLADHSSRPTGCPHQMPPEIEARIVELRLTHPGWGPRTIAHRLAREQAEPLPSRSSIYRCLSRHGLVDRQRRRRKREDYRRFERSRPMELWQMDVMGGVRVPARVQLRLARRGTARARPLGRELQPRTAPPGHRHGRPGAALRLGRLWCRG